MNSETCRIQNQTVAKFGSSPKINFGQIENSAGFSIDHNQHQVIESLYTGVDLSFFFLAKGETTTPRAILTGHDYEITCAAVCAELGLVLSGSQGKVMFYTNVGSSYDVLLL